MSFFGYSTLTLADELTAAEITTPPTTTANPSAEKPSTGLVTGIGSAFVSPFKFCPSAYSGFGFTFWEAAFTDSFWVFWHDILVKYNTNACHYYDLESLMDRMDKMRAAMRKAAFDCDNVTASRVNKQYRELNLELFYLRNFAVINYISSPDLDQKDLDAAIYPDSTSKSKFLAAAKKVGFSDAQSLLFYEKYRKNYLTKIKEYQSCSNWLMGSSAQAFSRLKNISSNYQIAKNLFKKSWNRSVARFQQAQKRIESNPGIAPINSIFNSAEMPKLWTHLVDIRVNGDSVFDSNSGQFGSPKTTILSQETRPPNGYTAAQANEDLQERLEDQELANIDAMYFAEYDLKYRALNGSSLRDQLNSLNTLETIIRDEINNKHLPKLSECTGYIVTNQCKNKPIVLE